MHLSKKHSLTLSVILILTVAMSLLSGCGLSKEQTEEQNTKECLKVIAEGIEKRDNILKDGSTSLKLNKEAVQAELSILDKIDPENIKNEDLKEDFSSYHSAIGNQQRLLNSSDADSEEEYQQSVDEATAMIIKFIDDYGMKLKDSKLENSLRTKYDQAKKREEEKAKKEAEEKAKKEEEEKAKKEEEEKAKKESEEKGASGTCSRPRGASGYSDGIRRPAGGNEALQKARDYSDLFHMSKAALYEQLTSEYGEGYSSEVAQYAIDHLNADYNYNALMKARSYRDDMGLSTDEIYEQLVSEYGEQFTPSQAQYAIDNM